VQTEGSQHPGATRQDLGIILCGRRWLKQRSSSTSLRLLLPAETLCHSQIVFKTIHVREMRGWRWLGGGGGEGGRGGDEEEFFIFNDTIEGQWLDGWVAVGVSVCMCGWVSDA
jgi:hypothetical protein